MVSDDYVPDVALLVRQIEVRFNNQTQEVEQARTNLFEVADLVSQHGDTDNSMLIAAMRYRKESGKLEELRAIRGMATRLVHSPASGVAGVPHEIVRVCLEIQAAYDRWLNWVQQ